MQYLGGGVNVAVLVLLVVAEVEKGDGREDGLELHLTLLRQRLQIRRERRHHRYHIATLKTKTIVELLIRNSIPPHLVMK